MLKRFVLSSATLASSYYLYNTDYMQSKISDYLSLSADTNYTLLKHKNLDLLNKKITTAGFKLEDIPLRSDIINKLKAEELDILIIGGGATGLGVAIDSSTRGLSTGLIERYDFASGSSSRSTKLVHGGMRYLEKAIKNLDWEQYTLVKEALNERKFFFESAPHLAHPLPIILPFYQDFPYALFSIPYYWIGCKFYDLVSWKNRLEPSYYLSRREALEKFPMLKHEGLKGGVVYYDGQQNDTRTAVALAQTANIAGAAVANYVELKNLIKNEEGKVCGARVRDILTGDEWNIKAKSVVNATGPFCDAIRSMDKPDTKKLIVPSSGVHIMLSKKYSPDGMGLISPSSDGRVLFLLPWENGTIAGTTDSSCEITPLPKPHEDEIEFILKEVRNYLDINVNREDVDAAWSGLRPLAKDPESTKTGKTEAISRNHVIEVSPSGLLTITGGKWTTYRLMAEHSVDRILRDHPKLRKKAEKCVSEQVKLIGAHAYSQAGDTKLVRAGFSESVAFHLNRNYGDKASEVAKLAINEGLNKILATGYPFIEAEVLYGIRHEYAQNTVDVLARRMRLAYLHRDIALQTVPRVIELMGKELNWDEKRRVDEYTDAITFLSTMGRKVPNSKSSNSLFKTDLSKRVSSILNRNITDKEIEGWRKIFNAADKKNTGHILRATGKSILKSEPNTEKDEADIEDNWMELEEFVIQAASSKNNKL